MKMCVLIFLCLVLILVPVLAGCANSNAGTTPSTEEALTETGAATTANITPYEVVSLAE